MKLLKLLLCFVCCAIGELVLTADSSDENYELFDLEELEVLGQTFEKPDLVFKRESPQITYYTPPKLPKGEVILALDFIDRYEAAEVPGATKWVAIINFPWIDGHDQRYVAWLCLYLWDGRVYGFSPTAKYDREMRFALPISVDRKTDPEELYSMASKYVEEISPADVEVIYWEDVYGSGDEFSSSGSGFDDPSGGGFTDPMAGMEYTTEVEFLDIPAGRIEGWRPFDKGKKREELVSLVYQSIKDPNPDSVASGAMGPDEQYKEANKFWKKNFSFDFSPTPHPFETARELLKPRWSMIAILYYEKNVLFFKDVNHKAEILLFNVRHAIFAYHPRYGVWKTDATLSMIAEGRGSDLITYPGVEKPMRVQLRLWKDQLEKSN